MGDGRPRPVAGATLLCPLRLRYAVAAVEPVTWHLAHVGSSGLVSTDVAPLCAHRGPGPVLPIRDEVLVEAPTEAAGDVLRVVVESLVEGMVPVVVDASVRSTWADIAPAETA